MRNVCVNSKMLSAFFSFYQETSPTMLYCGMDKSVTVVMKIVSPMWVASGLFKNTTTSSECVTGLVALTAHR